MLERLTGEPVAFFIVVWKEIKWTILDYYMDYNFGRKVDLHLMFFTRLKVYG